tara:strand:- start:138 stop:530 length:393 start_codon:yes stop_codon:yes gene_type:complete
MKNDKFSNPRVIIVQKIYSKYLNKDSEIIFSKHRYKKFIKDVTLGTLERKELIEETIDNYLSNDMNLLRTEKLLIVLLHAAIFELLYRPQTSVNIIINEYLNASAFFLDENQKKYLNALLDKASKKIREK